METLGVQNSRFELESAFSTLLVEEKGKQIASAVKSWFSAKIVSSLSLSRKTFRAQKPNLSLGATRGKGQSPEHLKENPVLDLTGKNYGKHEELVGPTNPVRCLALPHYAVGRFGYV